MAAQEKEERRSMSQLEFATDLTTWFVEGTFIAALVFSVIYGFAFDWRHTVTGRCTLTLDLSIAGALLHSVLIIWGIQTVHLTHTGVENLSGFWNETLTWISVISLGGAGAAITILTWQCTRYLNAQSENRFLNKFLRLGSPQTKR
jgi:hypothetical protein